MYGIDPLRNDVMGDVIDFGVVAKGVRRSASVVMVMSAVLLAGCAFVSTTSLDLSASFGLWTQGLLTLLPLTACRKMTFLVQV